MLVESNLAWRQVSKSSEGEKVPGMELVQQFRNGFEIKLAEVFPLPVESIENHKNGVHFQSQFLCEVKDKVGLKSTKTMAEARSNIDNYFGNFTVRR